MPAGRTRRLTAASRGPSDGLAVSRDRVLPRTPAHRPHRHRRPHTLDGYRGQRGHFRSRGCPQPHTLTPAAGKRRPQRHTITVPARNASQAPARTPSPARPARGRVVRSGHGRFGRRDQSRLRLAEREVARGLVGVAVNGRSGGSSAAHSSWARGQRVRNRQPDGGVDRRGQLARARPGAPWPAPRPGPQPGRCRSGPWCTGAPGGSRPRRPARPRPACPGTSRRSRRPCTAPPTGRAR